MAIKKGTQRLQRAHTTSWKMHLLCSLLLVNTCTLDLVVYYHRRPLEGLIFVAMRSKTSNEIGANESLKITGHLLMFLFTDFPACFTSHSHDYQLLGL